MKPQLALKPHSDGFDSDEIVARLGDEARCLAGKTVLLTGARGFLGRHFTAVFERLNAGVLEQPVNVVLLDNFVTGHQGEEPPQLSHTRFMKHDVIQPFEWDEPLDYIVHAAGIASPFHYRARPMETLEVAITGTKNMLELAKAHQARLTFFSSSEIYGDPDPQHIPIQESYRGNVSCRGPRACYDESKRVGETLCYVYHEYYGTHTNTIRPFNIYGPGMQESDYRVLPNFASCIKSGRPLQVYGRGSQTRTFCYLTDAMVGFLKVILNGVPGEAYNIGNPEPEITVLELVAAITEALGRPVEHVVTDYPDSYPADEPMRRCPDIRKARTQLDFKPRVDLNEGLGRFLAWTDKHYTG